MPIRPEMRERYPKDWSQIRERILKRAGQRRSRRVITRDAKCEKCGVENHAIGYRTSTGDFVALSMAEADVASMDGEHVIQIVLTIAHVNDPTPENCADENLAAWCQRCHLLHDLPQHLVSRVENEIERDVAAGQMLITDLLPKKEAS